MPPIFAFDHLGIEGCDVMLVCLVKPIAGHLDAVPFAGIVINIPDSHDGAAAVQHHSIAPCEIRHSLTPWMFEVHHETAAISFQ
ncbi:hypothetical protein D3C86_1926710 [compost metagenome]